MNLVDLIEKLEKIDDELIIFIEDINDYNSDILLDFGKEDDRGVKEKDGKEYSYLLEVFLAKEFVADWKSSLYYAPSNDEIAKRLYEYGVNDA